MFFSYRLGLFPVTYFRFEQFHFNIFRTITTKGGAKTKANQKFSSKTWMTGGFSSILRKLTCLSGLNGPVFK